ncbi:MAG: hypothetical protein AB1467_02655 [Candidatus Diapherotrites archaeon]
MIREKDDAMPSLEKHIELSFKRTGREHREVHEWLDGRKLSAKERIERHDIANIPKFLPAVEKQFGREGVKEYLQHIKDDYDKSILLLFLGKIRKLKLW